MLNIKLPKVIPNTVCVFKILIGEHFYIGKSSNLNFVKSEIQNTYGKYLRNGISESNMFYPVVKKAHKNPTLPILIEVLLASDNGYEILKVELELLSKEFGKPLCLNMNNIPHIPKTAVAAKGSNWLTMNQSLNFRKLLSKYRY
jgi:hypothetical protein